MIRKFPLACLALLLLVAWGNGFAQTPLPSPNFNLYSDGTINAEVAYPADGSVIVGGNFSSINGQPRKNLAKIKTDGTLDPNWTPSCVFNVAVLAVDNAGNVYVAGNGVAILKVSGSGTGVIDGSFTPNPNNIVTALAVDTAGNIYAGGYFSYIGGQTRQYLAKLSASTGQADPNWNPAPDSNVWALATDSTGNVYAGGQFQNIGGQARNNLAKLSPTATGTADATWNPNPNGQVTAIGVDSSNNVYPSGYFSNIGGQLRGSLAKLSSTGSGSADPTWDPNPDSLVQSFAFDGSGNVFAAGYFSTIGGQPRSGIAKLATTGNGVASSWNVGSTTSAASCPGSLCANFNAVAFSGSGMIVAGGIVDSISGQTRRGLAEFATADASLQPATDALRPGNVYALVPQPGGGLIVGGDFQFAGATQRSNLLRLNPDGTLDTSWAANTDGLVETLAIDGTGDIYVGGQFLLIGGQFQVSLAKLTSAGSVVSSWSPNPNGGVDKIAVDNGSNLYASGYFSSIGGQNRSDIAKISTSTGLADPAWNPGLNAGASGGLAIDNTNGWLYAGGYFTQAGGQTHNSLVRFATSGSGAADANWNPSPPNGQVNSMIVDNTGALFVGGYFNNIGGQTVGNIAKIASADGSADSTWKPNVCGPFGLAIDGQGSLFAGGCGSIERLSTTGSGADPILPPWNASLDNNVFAMAIDANNNVYVGGSFTTIAGESRAGLAAFHADAIFSNGFEQ